MFKCSFSNIIYNQRLIISAGIFETEPGLLAVITGESGSGKSTLFDALTLNNNWAVDYIINDISLPDLSAEEQSHILYQYFSVVGQKSQLIDDLTIQEHMDMVKGLTGKSLNIDDYIDLLDIRSLLNHFPNQLSGGERTRVSLFLSLLKDTYIYIYDEPTSSLDDEYTHVIIDILNELKNKGKIIIVMTHDQMIINQSDIHYHIENHQLLLKKKSTQLVELNKYEDKMKKDLNYVYRVFPLMKHHQKLYKKICNIFITLSIAIVSFSYSFSSYAYHAQQKQLKELESNELLVYKPELSQIGSKNLVYTRGCEPILKKEDYKKIETIDHVSSVEWRYDVIEPNYLINEDMVKVPYDPDNENPIFNQYNTNIIENNKRIKKINLSKNSGVYISSYLKNNKSNKDIKIDFNSEGIYLSFLLAKLIANELDVSLEQLKGKSMEIDLSIPIYNNYGKWQGETENGEMVFIHTVTVEHEKIILPIAGVLNYSTFGVPVYSENALFVERSVFKNLIEKHQKKEPRKLYLIGDTYEKVFLNECPEKHKSQITRNVVETPWQPSAVSVYVDGIENIESVTKKLRNLGFGVENEYVDSQIIGASIKTMYSTMLKGSIFITIIVMLVFIILEYNSIKKEDEVKNYFYQLGLSQKEVKILNRKRYIKEFFNELLITSLLTIGILIFMNVITMTRTSLSIYSIIIIFILSLFVHYIIPQIMNWKR